MNNHIGRNAGFPFTRREAIVHWGKDFELYIAMKTYHYPPLEVKIKNKNAPCTLNLLVSCVLCNMKKIPNNIMQNQYFKTTVGCVKVCI